MVTDTRCKSLQFSIEGHDFVKDVRLLSIPGYDMILGLDWLMELGPMNVDWGKGRLEFSKDGKNIILQMKSEVAEVKVMEGSVSVAREVQRGSEIMIAHLMMIDEGSPSTEKVHPQLKNLINEYAMLFEEPVGLPPKRGVDHQIPLMPDAKLVNLRPYSKSLKEHEMHLKIAMSILKENKLYAKMSKCEFGSERLEYLGHIISSEGVPTDPKKIENAFGWNDKAEKAFELLKQAMITVHVLAMPDFSKPFIIETDANDIGIGAVLMQGRRPIAYLSKSLCEKNKGLSTYEKEFLALLTAAQKWRHYLIGGPFVIKTDQISLKYLLEQKVNPVMQHKDLCKLLG
ncbi:polyprotein [Rhynchospora pubera]|uniref:Polyprotein n=1 Tax=Rhynchospora pubera TaxID=906938 RepID=A0AAV8GR03_9POAL|nr:polyprotein [Rhynchospora pubera]